MISYKTSSRTLISNLLISFVVLAGILACSASRDTFTKDKWQVVGRGSVRFNNSSVTLKDCFIHQKDTLYTYPDLRFQARSAKQVDQVQIWAGFSFRDRDTRYAVALRGGNCDDVYLCRYTPGGHNTMLGLAPLDFHVETGRWYGLRVVKLDSVIQVYVNDEQQPRLVARDTNPLAEGGIVLGGGWIATEFRDLQVAELTAAQRNNLQNRRAVQIYSLSREEKDVLRAKQRAEWRTRKIAVPDSGRAEIPLDGDWLFMPVQDVPDEKSATDPAINDTLWHVFTVPAFWNPVTNWMHYQPTSMPHPGSGVSDNYWQRELQRCEKLTFDYRATRSAWYRQWIELPHRISGRRFYLHFDAVSKLTDVWVNGNHAGKHVGMFGAFGFDISSLVKPGKNLIAVRVGTELDQNAAANKDIAGVAVTVEVTNEMLHSLPRGMFEKENGGIWQPVKLVVTGPVRINDIFARTRTDGADIDLEILNSAKPSAAELRLRILSEETDQLLFSTTKQLQNLPAGQVRKITITTGKLKPKLWSPEQPHLYRLQCTLISAGQVADQRTEVIGFRTFEVRGNKFYLNGKPYWLRGANHPPLGIAANDSLLANVFLKNMHDNNQMVTRTHGAPLSETWARAADRQGVGLSVEGTWPWLMLGKDLPSDDLLKIWRDEMLDLVKKYRNHPSVLIWTMGNEMYFTNYYHKDPPAVRLKKWRVLSDAIKAVRAADPTRPVSATSGYIRYQPDYEKVLQPAGIDDGDLDDSHNSYFGWYNPDQFYLMEHPWTGPLYLSTGANPDRPFISQELSSGYPNNDTGHPTRKYIFRHYVPQAWVGDWAYEDHDPRYYLQRNAFLTKEIAEVLRRTSPGGAGILHFANLCWYGNVYDAGRLTEYPVVPAMNKALSPILVSAALLGRSWYAGSKLATRVFIVNDAVDGRPLPQGLLRWQLSGPDGILLDGSRVSPPVDMAGRAVTDIEIELPAQLPSARLPVRLQLSLEINGNLVSSNDYELLLVRKDWVTFPEFRNSDLFLYDPAGSIREAFGFCGIPFTKWESRDELPESGAFIAANLDTLEGLPGFSAQLPDYLGRGNQVLLIHPGKKAAGLFPGLLREPLQEAANVIGMHVPESPVFDGIEPLELSWWQSRPGQMPVVSRRVQRLRERSLGTELARYVRIHAYLARPEQLAEMSGSPLIQAEWGAGRLLICELELDKAPIDPIAGRLLRNMIYYLTDSKK